MSVTSADCKTKVCCLLAVGYFSLGILKNVLYKLQFVGVNKLGISYV